MSVPSYQPPGYPAPAPRARPTTVTVATYLLYAVAAIQVINAILTFSMAGTMSDAVRDAYAGTEAEGAESLVTGFTVFGGVINLLLGLGFAALAYFDGRGKNAARIVTWVIGGLALCCLGLGLGSTALLGSLDDSATTSGPSQDEIERRISDALPSWYTPTTTTLSVLGLLAILAAIILLALPASNEFFRKPAANAGWDPNQAYPYPGGAQQYGQQPGGPQYGQQPGGPQYGGQPGGQYPGGPNPGAQYPGGPTPGYGQPPYPGQQPHPNQPPYPGQPGQPAPGLPPYPGQTSPPPASDPYGPPSPGPYDPPPSAGNEPPRPPTDPA